MQESEIRWNDEAREKILNDADGVLREAVVDLGATMNGKPWEEVYAELISRMEGRFIDFEPGPDIRKYAEAVSDGDVGSGTSS